jgi:hypothetical protein
MSAPMDILDFNGVPLSREPMGLKVRMAKVFRRTGQTMVELNNEIKMLGPDDLTWFQLRFEECGYPCLAADRVPAP